MTDFTAGVSYGQTSMEIMATMDGVTFLTQMMSGDLPAPPMAGALNFRLIDVAEGKAVFRGMANENHYNPLGTVHGGWAATILDSALACCVHATLKQGEFYTTVEFKVNLVRPILATTGPLTATGTVVHRGRTLATSEASLKDDAGKLYAHGTETCAIFPIERVMGGGR